MTQAVVLKTKADPVALALLVYARHAAADAAKKELDAVKADLIEVGGDGQTYIINETTGAKVQVTKETPRVPTGNLRAAFDIAAFHELPEAQRNKLVKAGVVTYSPEYKGGSAPSVRVTRK